MPSHARGHVQEMGAVAASEHSKVGVQCHQRRASGNWHPHTPLGPVGDGMIRVESNLASHIESHQSAPTAGSFSLLGVYPKIIIIKRTSYS